MAERSAPSFSHRLGGRPSITAEAVAVARAMERTKPEAERILDDPYATWFLERGRQGGADGVAGERARHPDDEAARHRRRGVGVRAGAPPLHRRPARVPRSTTAPSRSCSSVPATTAGPTASPSSSPGGPSSRSTWRRSRRRRPRIVQPMPRSSRPSTIHRVEIDFETQTLADTLGAAGFTTGARTFVVWEGVSMYLTRGAVKGTLRAARPVRRRARGCRWTCGTSSTTPARSAPSALRPRRAQPDRRGGDLRRAPRGDRRLPRAARLDARRPRRQRRALDDVQRRQADGAEPLPAHRPARPSDEDRSRGRGPQNPTMRAIRPSSATTRSRRRAKLVAVGGDRAADSPEIAPVRVGRSCASRCGRRGVVAELLMSERRSRPSTVAVGSA